MCNMNIMFQQNFSEKEKIEFLDGLETILQKYIHHKRYVHIKGVEFTAVAMAMKFGYESGMRSKEAQDFLFRVQIAGLLHDNAKCMTDEEYFSECQRLQIPVSEFEKSHAFILHGKVGAAYLEDRYGIVDDEIASAIAYHTTGKPAMSMMEKIIFIADYIEPSRTKQVDLDLVRALAFTDLDTCVYKIASDTLQYLSGASLDIDEMTKQTMEYYQPLAKLELLRG